MIYHLWTHRECVDIDIPAEIDGRLRERRKWILATVIVGYVAFLFVAGSFINGVLDATHASDRNATLIVTVGTVAAIGGFVIAAWIADAISDALERSFIERYWRSGHWPR